MFRIDAVPRHVDGCRAAAREAAEILAAGGTALEAAERAVRVMEDDPCFNAGTGACLNEAGEIELDAAIMDGKELRAGAVGALPPFLHPISIARVIIDEGRHVLYAGEGAARFAIARGFTRATAEAMTTARARERWELVRAKGGEDGWAGGTVGAVARDARGHVAAATSTGGMVGKAIGRVGDTPILGAGTYADDEAGACSATGKGEAIMRVCLAKTVIEWMRSGVATEDAARAAARLVERRGRGTGGLILVSPSGTLGLARCTTTMTWAAAGEKLGEAAGS